VRLTVSDIRENILINLKERLSAAGINIYKTFTADLRKPGNTVPEEFDIILCDAPCTGSGTWSRTPEQLYYFDKKKISEYVLLQQNIISNTITAFIKGGLYFYITCSVFESENEAQVSFIRENFPVQLLHMEYLEGYDVLADTLFVAVFTKN
jgi:16S rRNA (cytosine967-C5)-methyltransferase